MVIPRAAFRAYGPRVDYLACTVAHEIAHIRNAKKLGEMKRSLEL